MRDIFILNPSNDAPSTHVMNKQSVGVSRRRGLADITNLEPTRKVSDKGKLVLLSDQELTQKLQQENATLKKQLVESNKTIELYGFAIQQLRANLQKYQLQNSQLAQANSQILCQLNTSKDKLKVIQHELACRNNLLAFKGLELLEVKKSGPCQEIDNKRETSKEAGMSSLADDNSDKPCSANNEQDSRGICSAVGIQSAAIGAMAEEDPGSRRYRTRRKSSRFKSLNQDPDGNMPNMNGEAYQSMSKRPEACPSAQESHETFISSSADIDGSKPSTDKHQRKAKRGSVAKHASNGEKFETKRPRTRSSMLKSEEQQEDFKVDAKVVVSPLNNYKMLEDNCRASLPLPPSVTTKDVVKNEDSLSLTREVRKRQDLGLTLEDSDRCSSGTGIGQLGATELSITKGTSQVEKTETKRPCSRRQSSTQDSNDNKRSLGRPVRSAAAQVKSYQEIPVNMKMRRPG